MPAHNAYRKPRAGDITRIDTILGLYDQALNKIAAAADALGRNDLATAQSHMNKGSIAISGLVCAVQGRTDELSCNFLRLYAFVTRRMTELTPESASAAKQILETLREGFEAIRPEALRLERAGVIAPLDRAHSIEVNA
jgi:flagellar protein FliS